VFACVQKHENTRELWRAGLSQSAGNSRLSRREGSMPIDKTTAVGIACVCLLAGSARIVNAQTMANSFDELTAS
jgi:hypothetical protein